MTKSESRTPPIYSSLKWGQAQQDQLRVLGDLLAARESTSKFVDFPDQRVNAADIVDELPSLPNLILSSSRFDRGQALGFEISCDDGDLGLAVHASSGGFAAAGIVWTQWYELRKFREALSSFGTRES